MSEPAKLARRTPRVSSMANSFDGDPVSSIALLVSHFPISVSPCRTNTSNTLGGSLVLLDERDFCEALDGFETVEQRFGK